MTMMSEIEEITEQVDPSLSDEELEGEVDGEVDGEATGSEADQAHAEMFEAYECQDQTFEELRLPAETVAAAQEAWATFLSKASSREAAGESIYAALFDSAPSLQSLFKTPRAVMAMRFMNGLHTIVTSMHQPAAMKITVETLGFQHLDLEVTIPRVGIFREAIVDLLNMELGEYFTTRAASGLGSLLNYVGGAYIYVRVKYAIRVKVILSSWATANNKKAELEDGTEEESKAGKDAEEAAQEEDEQPDPQVGAQKEEKQSGNQGARSSQEAAGKVNNTGMSVPTTFDGMFMFNGAVMGFGSSLWMKYVLESFDTIVLNVSNSYRLQEECDTLSLRMAKYKGSIQLSEFKAVMLASLRSLVPKDWNSDHEVAWTWLWENVERMLKGLLGKPQVQEKALERFIMSLTEDSQNFLRREVYKKFFALAPGGQDYFKQSTTRLYWIADKIVEMTIEIYRDPVKMVEDISALGLRHVGYGIPTEFFAPFVSGAVEVVRLMTTDESAEDGFRWSLSLISRILVRTIMEGSTIVMKSINTNSAKSLRRAVACAPRGKRAVWMLNITVGTQSISPLYWSIESGSLETAKAMLVDLFIIRADRDNYYYGVDHVFERHPDVVKRLCSDAQVLLPTLLDGLVWRSRVTANAQRRVNFYIKHLIVDAEGQFNQALECLVDAGDPKIVCHPVVVLFSDLIWGRLASRAFFLGRCWFLLTLMVFVTSQSILVRVSETEVTRIATFVCRCFVYLASMGQLIRSFTTDVISDIKSRSFVRMAGIPVPSFLSDWKSLNSFLLLLCLLILLCLEPILHCFQASGSGDPTSGLFAQSCHAADKSKGAYSGVSMVAMMLYSSLLIDLSIFSMRVSAFVLVCGRVLAELALCLGALTFMIVTFGSAIPAMDQSDPYFVDIPTSMVSLTQIVLGMYPSEGFQHMLEEPYLLISVSVFIVVSLIFLLNLMTVQLNGAYQANYTDMVGFARLNRGKIMVETLESVSQKRWNIFLAGLQLDERLEFNEGDVGLAGGIQTLEPANANPTTVDMIKRFGGSTSPAMPWPEDAGGQGDDNDKFERLETTINKAMKKISGGGRHGSGSRSGASGLGSSAVAGNNSDSNGSGGSVAGSA
ncbi:unnamed protein product [Polarella glacialis]|uniref:Globin domain-containing protein n=1 Tax=Polarella glacialis TaxID=89957 RepID=A0A813IX56_POLGL|nr:unnamed protein product [Polarella glacialis]